MEKNMRHYKLAPTWKKSVVEYSTFMKDGILAKYELGWRWGDFLINIPETDGFEKSSGCTLQFLSTELFPLHNFQNWDCRCQ